MMIVTPNLDSCFAGWSPVKILSIFPQSLNRFPL